MIFENKITILKENIYNQLNSLIDNNYVLYDVPYYNNIGDLLIWEGELAFLKQFPYKMIDFCSLRTYRDKKIINDNTIILLQGGGNFGDIWRKIQDFRLNIIQQYPNNKIIIFPQTVFYKNSEFIKADAQIMSQHKNLTICARDKVSYELLKKHFKNQILLVPDMAFCIPTEQLKKCQQPLQNKSLFLKRSDKELKCTDYKVQSKYPLTVSDWITMEHTDLIQIGLRFTSLLRKLKMPQFMDWYGMHIYRPSLIKKGIEFISPYKEIYTTRLHVAILCTLLNKPFHFIDNSYGKNRAFYETWLNDLDEIHFL